MQLSVGDGSAFAWHRGRMDYHLREARGIFKTAGTKPEKAPFLIHATKHGRSRDK